MTGQENAIRLTQQMVQIDSTNPGAAESGMEQFLLDFARRADNAMIQIQTEEVLPGRRNVMLSIPGRTKEAELVYICHMDTVPVGEGWEAEPFSGEIVEERLYGRGACDMKSGFACALSAFQTVAGYCRGGEIPKRTIKLIGTVDEEGEMAGVERLIQSGWVSADSLVLDTEPTNGEIQVAHKGRTWFEITVQGITAHASTPWKGADAIAAMAEIISFIRKEFVHLKRHEELGAATVSFGRIRGGEQPYVVSGDCSVTVDMRLVPPYSTSYAEELVKRAIFHAEEVIPKIKVEYQITGDRPYIEKEEHSVLLHRLRGACKKITGVPVKTGVFNGYTDTAVIAGKLGNPDCMSYGPGDLELAHKPDESVPLEDIRRCEKVLTELALELLF